MPERRGSVYDPARDIFTQAEDAIAEGQDNSGSSNPKRKRSSSPDGTSAPRAQSPSNHDNSQAEENTPPTKRPKPTSEAILEKPTAPLPVTAANLSQIRAKKNPNARAQGSSRRPERSRSPARQSSDTNRQARRRSPPPPRRRTPSPQPINRSPSRSPPRQRKRPGAASRIPQAETEAIRRRQQEREQAEQNIAQLQASARGVHDVVRQHYNAVPQRGREWRKTGSLIKGLRSLNNWVKAAVIQKFSPSESFQPGATGSRQQDDRGLLVLDIGCGKGGDLQKWQQAPQKLALYVGLDPADVSIDQARERYSEMQKGGRGGGGYRDRGPSKRIFQAEFLVKDCYGEWIGDLPIVQEVGIDPSVGPTLPGAINMSSRFGGGGFDVVTMMFCMHYAFESEAKARGMLKNVAGSLKKGGRFIGVIPNSDILTSKVAEHNKKHGVSVSGASAATAAAVEGAAADDDDDDDWDPEKTLDSKLPPPPQAPTEEFSPSATTDNTTPPLEFGNGIYQVKFPTSVPLPADGIFRPPYGWKYFYFLEEAVEQVPEYVVPWEAFRALALEYDLELRYRRPFSEVWEAEKDDRVLGPLSERMGVQDRDGRLAVSPDEFEAAGKFCFHVPFVVSCEKAC